MDGEGVLWEEGGCENGAKKFHVVRPLKADEQQNVRSAFAALPPPSGCSDARDTFSLRAADGSEKVWHVCERAPGSPGGPGDPEGLPRPFELAARSLKR